MSFSRSIFAKASLLYRPRAHFYSVISEGSIAHAKAKYVPDKGTYPRGFSVGSTHVGIKPGNTRFDDLIVLLSDRPCSVAAVFTQNKFQAAPVTVSRNLLDEYKGRGFYSVVVNSGCANAVTGKGGIEDAYKMVREADRSMGRKSDRERSIVMSTGVIGQRYD